MHTLGVREHLDDADDPNDVEPIVVQNPGGSTYRIYIDTVTSFWGPAFIPGQDGLPPRGGLLGVVNRVLAKMQGTRSGEHLTLVVVDDARGTDSHVDEFRRNQLPSARRRAQEIADAIAEGTFVMPD